MKKYKVEMLVMAVFFALIGNTAQAQDWKSILSGVANGIGKAVVGNQASSATIPGTWQYVAPDCQFASDNLLAKAGGEVAAKKVEEKMTEICTKFKINPSNSSFTFNEDGTYSQTINKRTLKGTYTFNSEEQTITLKTSLGLSFTATVEITGSTMRLLFNADKLFSLLKSTAGVISKKSTNSALSTLTSLSEQYNGLKLGFELKKQ